MLIAGGQGKDADFRPLLQLAPRLKGLVLLGEAAAEIAGVMGDSVDTVLVDDMDSAVNAAAAMAGAGDRVLLSPACASFDMYSGYQQRGDVFAALARQYIGGARSE